MTQVVAVVGPTASGKTSLAIALAQALDTEIVSADSMQFYRGMEIGTGAPTPEERASVKHHFVGFLDPSDAMDAGQFQEAARAVIEELNLRGKIAVVAGGSGLYVQALIDGLFNGPGKDPAIRARLEKEAEETGPEALHRRLEEVDPDYAGIVDENDPVRIVRGLEVYELTGIALSVLHRDHRSASASLDALQVALDWPRDQLYARINARVDAMFNAGLAEEVQRLLDSGYRADIQRLKSLGYREVLSYLEGAMSFEEASDLMKMYTRRYAKRQLTWFKGDTRVEWLDINTLETDLVRVKHILETVVARST